MVVPSASVARTAVVVQVPQCMVGPTAGDTGTAAGTVKGSQATARAGGTAVLLLLVPRDREGRAAGIALPMGAENRDDRADKGNMDTGNRREEDPTDREHRAAVEPPAAAPSLRRAEPEPALPLAFAVFPEGLPRAAFGRVAPPQHRHQRAPFALRQAWREPVSHRMLSRRCGSLRSESRIRDTGRPSIVSSPPRLPLSYYSQSTPSR
jgi:hypothetical protein